MMGKIHHTSRNVMGTSGERSDTTWSSYKSLKERALEGSKKVEKLANTKPEGWMLSHLFHIQPFFERKGALKERREEAEGRGQILCKAVKQIALEAHSMNLLTDLTQHLFQVKVGKKSRCAETWNGCDQTLALGAFVTSLILSLIGNLTSDSRISFAIIITCISIILNEGGYRREGAKPFSLVWSCPSVGY